MSWFRWAIRGEECWGDDDALMDDEGTNKKACYAFLTLRAYMKRNAVMHV
jgi:hypothetical protein